LARTPGRLWLCGKHFIAPDPETAMRRVHGDLVVCLNEEFELSDRYPAYVAWLRAQPPERVVWAPIPDMHAPNVDAAVELTAELRRRLDDGHTLLMHCSAGLGRTGTIAAALLITMGTPLVDAVAQVAASRPMCGPQSEAQSDLLVDIATRVR
jgi:protein-tyrosine phosphatase